MRSALVEELVRWHAEELAPWHDHVSREAYEVLELFRSVANLRSRDWTFAAVAQLAEIYAPLAELHLILPDPSGCQDWHYCCGGFLPPEGVLMEHLVSWCVMSALKARHYDDASRRCFHLAPNALPRFLCGDTRQDERVGMLLESIPAPEPHWAAEARP